MKIDKLLPHQLPEQSSALSRRLSDYFAGAAGSGPQASISVRVPQLSNSMALVVYWQTCSTSQAALVPCIARVARVHQKARSWTVNCSRS